MNVGEGMKYSFGGDNKGTGVILPHIAFPVRSALQIKTVEGADVGSSNENNNNNDTWNTNETYSFMYSAQSIDLANWKVLLPFEMDVSRFWGDSPLRLVIYEQEAVDDTTMKPKEKKNYVFELQLEHMKLPSSSSSSSSYYNDHSNAKVTNNTTRRHRDEFLPV
jgi:hypothetical protein